ncbi:MAG: ABC transporter ATP-binding protein [Pseudomonadota bacterium]|nr:ABC transporter ATP-binding protein [Pseudomonadota bacterium]
MVGSPLQFLDVAKKFKRSKGEVQALQRLSFHLAYGQIIGLLGPDGAGKSTLMRMAAGLLLPDSGQVLVFGIDTFSPDNRIQSQIGFMPQRFGLYEDLTVQENLDLYSDLQGLNKEESQKRQQELLALTALDPFSKRYARALSGGMKQKLGLACALLRSPRLLLLDEPTVGVDPIARRELWEIIKALKEEGTTILISTAYFDEVERCDEVILLHEGQLLGQKTPGEFLSPLSNHTYLVNRKDSSRRQLQEELRFRQGVIDARIFTEGVRVLCMDLQIHPASGENWVPVPPTFEDAFVSLLGQKNVLADSPELPTRILPRHEINPEVVIEVNELKHFFGTFEAVKGVSFQVRKGQIFGLLGANGAGKTTTFRMLCGLLPVSAGILRVAGVDMRRASTSARALMGYVSQKFSLYGNLSCNQNLSFFSAAYGLKGKERRQRIDCALQEFQLSDYRDVNTDDLPLGIKQRLALACALLHDPLILFLDEPTSGVDPLARREFWQRVNGLAEGGVTILITTHFMDEAEYCDNLVLMSRGEVLAQGSPVEIRSKARNDVCSQPSMEDAFIYLIQEHEAVIRRFS